MIELIVVLVILGIAVGITAPNLRGWGMGNKLRDATQQFVSATRWARAESAAQAATMRVSLDTAERAYVVLRQSEGQFTEVAGEFGRPTILPEGFTLQLVSGGSDRDAIDFYPNLRATPAVVRITAPTGLSSDVACDYPAGSFKVAEAK
jgi:Tfp pilus assembly protein FimT